MEEKIYQILKKHKLTLKKREEILADLLLLFNVSGQSEELFCVYCLDTGKYKTFYGVDKCPNPKCKTNTK